MFISKFLLGKAKMGNLRNLLIFFMILSYVRSESEFARDSFGIEFNPFVKISEDGQPLPEVNAYTFENVKTMLTVVSSKFSNLLLDDFTVRTGSGFNNDIWNYSYHNGTYAQLYVPEAAAQINRQRQSPILKILLSVLLYDDPPEYDRDSIMLAFEATKKANGIFPGTVSGIVLTTTNIDGTVKEINLLHMYWNFTKEKLAQHDSLQLGVMSFCWDFLDHQNNSAETKVKQILEESDFLMCSIIPSDRNLEQGATRSFYAITEDLAENKMVAQGINPNLKFMVRSNYVSKGSNIWETVDNFQTYWKLADKWASENDVLFYMREAFDNPRRFDGQRSGHLGWWKLKNNSMINNINGYIEKVNELNRTLEPRDTKTVPVPAAEGFSLGTILGATACVIVIIIAAIYILNLIYSRRHAKQFDKKELRDFLHGKKLAGLEDASNVVENVESKPYDNSFEIPKQNLNIDRESVLGSGQFGCVFKATLHTNTGSTVPVALKMVKDDCCVTALRSILSEIKILAYLGKHPYIVSMEGAYTAELLNRVVFVATELCSLGSLESYLRGITENTTEEDTQYYQNQRYSLPPGETNNTVIYANEVLIPYSDMVQWSYEIACAMEYLESKQVVHADLAARNVLLTESKTAKVTDFGLSRRMYDYQSYVKRQQEPLPWRSMAIESLKRCEFSSQSDVWSYGVLLWEIFSLGDTPYPGLSWSIDFVKRLVNGLRLDCPEHATKEIYSLMLNCWQIEPELRPRFSTLKEELIALQYSA